MQIFSQGDFSTTRFKSVGWACLCVQTFFIAGWTHFIIMKLTRRIQFLFFQSKFWACLPNIFFKSLEEWFAGGSSFEMVCNFEAVYFAIVQPQVPAGFLWPQHVDNFLVEMWINSFSCSSIATIKPDNKKVNLSHLCHVIHAHKPYSWSRPESMTTLFVAGRLCNHTCAIARWSAAQLRMKIGVHQAASFHCVYLFTHSSNPKTVMIKPHLIQFSLLRRLICDM